jgi:hypothetical protein
MVFTLKNRLEAFAPFMHPDLIPDASLERLCDLAARLPWSNMGGFEVRLGEDKPVVDLFACLKPLTSAVPAEFLRDPVWRCLADCLASARTHASGFQRFIRRIDLEFDLDKPQPAVPVPSFFFNLDECHRDQDGRAVRLTASDLLAVVRQSSDFAICEHVRANIQTCIANLPQGASIRYLGLMARDGQALRLSVGGLPHDGISAYLSTIGWGGNAQALQARVGPLLQLGRQTGIVDLDVGTSISSKVGIECYMDRPASVSGWDCLLAKLVDLGLCAQSKREGLSHWISPSFPRRYDRSIVFPIPDHARNHEREFGFLWKSINHIKVVCHADRLVEAKAYLGFGHRHEVRLPVKRLQPVAA